MGALSSVDGSIASVEPVEKLAARGLSLSDAAFAGERR
jgi:hypothetical protein